MYDAKNLSEEYMEKHFKEALDWIALSLTCINDASTHDGDLMRECVRKITDRINALQAGEATEMLEGLGQIMGILESRINDLRILKRFVADPEFVPSAALARIVMHPLIYESCNLPEALIPCVPNDLLPEECRS